MLPPSNSTSLTMTPAKSAGIGANARERRLGAIIHSSRKKDDRIDPGTVMMRLFADAQGLLDLNAA